MNHFYYWCKSCLKVAVHYDMDHRCLVCGTKLKYIKADNGE